MIFRKTSCYNISEIAITIKQNVEALIKVS